MATINGKLICTSKKLKRLVLIIYHPYMCELNQWTLYLWSFCMSLLHLLVLLYRLHNMKAHQCVHGTQLWMAIIYMHWIHQLTRYTYSCACTITCTVDYITTEFHCYTIAVVPCTSCYTVVTVLFHVPLFKLHMHGEMFRFHVNFGWCKSSLLLLYICNSYCEVGIHKEKVYTMTTKWTNSFQYNILWKVDHQ